MAELGDRRARIVAVKEGLNSSCVRSRFYDMLRFASVPLEEHGGLLVLSGAARLRSVDSLRRLPCHRERFGRTSIEAIKEIITCKYQEIECVKSKVVVLIVSGDRAASRMGDA